MAGQIESQFMHPRFAVALLCTSLLFPIASTAQGQGGIVPKEAEERGLRQLISETKESIATEKWLEATERFDAAWKAACESGDPLMTVSGTDVRQLMPGETEEHAGGKAQLERLYHEAPDAFRNEYQRQWAEVAASKIKEAVQTGDLWELRNACVRYAFMPAASQGYEILVRVSIDRADFQEAALLLGRLERMSQLEKTSSKADRLLKLATCYAKAGLIEDSRDTLRVIQQLPADQQDDRLPNLKTPADVDLWLSSVTGDVAAVNDWLQPGGNYRRAALHSRTPASLNPKWSSSVYSMNDVLYADQYNELLSMIERNIERQFVRFLRENNTIVPSANALVHKDMAIVRTPFGVRAVRRDTGELVWEVTRPDSDVRSVLDRGLAPSLTQRYNAFAGSIQFMEPWRVFFTHSMRLNTSSQMSISGRTLFVVDECSAAVWNESFDLGFGNAQQVTIPSNFIRAYDVETGLFLWEIGGKSQTTAQPIGKGNLLSGFYFLGAPLVLGERTYVLGESGEGIFLIQIVEPNRNAGNPNPSIAMSQILTVPQYRLPLHPVRKLAGIMPSFAQGLLICPTCDERIVAVSAEDHSLRWMFRYGANVRRQELGGDAPVLFGGRDIFDSARVDMDARWIDTLPRVVRDRVLVTPRDSDQLFCLDLHSGKEFWRAARSGFHAIAATTEDAVILIGNQRVSSMRIEDGTVTWAAAIPDGIVTGTASCDGNVLQVPVSDPAILSFDVKTGQMLVRQPLPLGTLPGNLLTTADGVLMQSVSKVSWFPRSNETSDPQSIVYQATELLLNGKLDDAIAFLDKEAETKPLTPEVRSMMIEVMLRALQSDFGKYRSLLPKVRQLTDSSQNDVDVASALHVLLGMNPSDVPTAAKLLQGNERRFVDVLLELEAKEITLGQSSAADDYARNLDDLIRQLPEARTQQVASGLLQRTRASVLISSIRRGVLSRSVEDQRSITEKLRQTVEQTLLAQTTEKDQVQFVADLIDTGLFDAVEPLIAGEGIDRLKPHTKLLREQLRLQKLASGVDTTQTAAALLAEWGTQSQLHTIKSFLTDIATPAAPYSNQRFQISDEKSRAEVLAAWNNSGQLQKAIPSTWDGVPQVKESDDRTMLPASRRPPTTPDQHIPLFGPPGVFRDWSFARNSYGQGLGGDVIMAFDPDGVLRWQLKSVSTRPYGDGSYVSQSWLVASGHLLILCENEMLTAIDASEATSEHPPKVMWADFIAKLTPDDVLTEYQSFIPPSERVLQYSPQPSGMFPSGLIRLGTIPVLSGRRLTMLSAFTGAVLWHIDGVSPDSVMMGYDDKLLVISEQARHVEVRRVLDGAVESISRLPEWWGESLANVGSSVRTIELEDGSETIWRVSTHGRSCVLFRLTTGSSNLECRDLVTNELQWDVSLPEDTVFSNVVDDVVALLSEGNQLIFVQTDSGRTLAEFSVTRVDQPFDLILRKSHGQYVVLPAGDPETNDFPVTHAIYVKGRMYAIDAESLTLSWDKPLEDRHIRSVVQSQGALLPNVPALILVSRGSKGKIAGGLRNARYGAQIVDVRTGEDLYASNDVGATLNEHWMQIDATRKQLIVSFENRFLTLEYSGQTQKQ